MMRDSIWLVTTVGGISEPLPTMTARMHRILSGCARTCDGTMVEAHAEAGRNGAGLPGGRPHALSDPRRAIGGGVLLPEGLHPRLNERGRRVPPGIRQPPRVGLRGDRRVARPAGDERPLPGEPGPALLAGGRSRGANHPCVRRAVADRRPDAARHLRHRAEPQGPSRLPQRARHGRPLGGGVQGPRRAGPLRLSAERRAGAMPPSLSVVIPMCNEEAYVERSVAAARAALEEMGGDWEIVIVDDASTDGTGARADRLAAADPRVRVIHNPVNRRLGGTLRAGYAAATKDLVFYTDADLPVDLGQLPRAVRLLEYQQADLLAGYRFDRTSEGLQRALYTIGYHVLIRLLFGLRIRDVNFAFKLFRRSLLQRIELKSEGSFIDAELLLRARQAGAVMIQLGLDYFPRTRGPSKLSSLGVIAAILREMAEQWRELR